MSFPKYPCYKDSGVEWLGEVPEHWNVRTVRRLFTIRKRIAGKLGYDVLSITQQGIRVRDLESNDGQLSMDYSKYQIVEIGDFAMNHMDLLTGWVDIASHSGVTSPDYRVFRIRNVEDCCDLFLLFLFQSAYKNRIFYAYGQGSSHLGRWRLPTDAFNDFALPLPPLHEQTSIATFLSGETAKIDALIAEQQRLIDLLKEKRQAVISHAVTRGLDPGAPMKPSGVEWLGDVPAHWEVIPIKYIVSLRSGGTPDKSRLDYWDGSVPWASAKDLKRESISDTADHITEYAVEQGAATLIPAESTLVVVRGMILAHTFPVVQAEVPLAINQDLKALIAKPKLDPTFLPYVLRGSSRETLRRLDEAGHGTKALRMEAWTSMPLPVPPLPEQRAIAGELKRLTSEIDRLVLQAAGAVSLLQERRAALISATVTGKIDVRGVAMAEAA